MKRLALMACLLVLGCCPAVGAASSGSRDARVVGVIRLCGGPAPGRCFTQNGTVLVYSGQRLVATLRTNHAKFSTELAPGSYALEAQTGGTHRRVTVIARAHKTTVANIVIPIP
jgi:hypothetical protein